MAEGSQLVIYAPSATRNLTRCEEDCYLVQPANLPLGRLIVPNLSGGSPAACFLCPPPQSLTGIIVSFFFFFFSGPRTNL